MRAVTTAFDLGRFGLRQLSAALSSEAENVRLASVLRCGTDGSTPITRGEWMAFVDFHQHIRDGSSRWSCQSWNYAESCWLVQEISFLLFAE